ncbi:MAG: HD domain-containing protein [Actinomycetota bacterium]|nr:HD domain-containing protein [Actinomycetota bacterium]
MERLQARALVDKYTDKDITVRHLISVEGVMRALADRFGADPNRWGLVGLWHDLDYDQTQEDLDRHGLQTVEWLRDEGCTDDEVLNAILGHRFEQNRTDLMSMAIVHADAVAGLLVAAALVRPEKAAGMSVKSVKKKLKEKSFAPGVDREEIRNVESSIGLTMDDFIGVSISGLQSVAPEIDLE